MLCKVSLWIDAHSFSSPTLNFASEPAFTVISRDRSLDSERDL